MTGRDRQNPLDEQATAEVSYYGQDGSRTVRRYLVGGNSRLTLFVNAEAGANVQLACRVKVLSGPGIIVERPMYFSYSGWDGGHDIIGEKP